MTGVSTSLSGTGKSGSMAILNISESYNVATNSSVLTLALSIASGWYAGVTYSLDGNISIDGSPVVTFNSAAGTNSAYIPAMNQYVEVGGSPWQTGNVIHNDDGTKMVEVSFDIKGYTRSGGAGSGWRIAKSVSLELSKIPRASTIAATDANIGSVSSVIVNRKADIYNHVIAYKFIGLSGYLSPDGGVSSEPVHMIEGAVAFRLPESFYGQIPNTKSDQCELTCTTYYRGKVVGSPVKTTFKVTAAEDVCKPALSASAKDVNPNTVKNTGDDSKMVKFESIAEITVNAVPRKNATIASVTVNEKPVSNGSIRIPAIENGDILVQVTDSRGYVSSEKLTLTVIPYVILTTNAVAKRTDPTSGEAVLRLQGNAFDGSFGATNNALKITYTVGSGDPVTVIPGFSGNSYLMDIPLTGLNYKLSYRISITATDNLGSVSQVVILPKGIPHHHWGKDHMWFETPVSAQGNPLIEARVGFILITTSPESPEKIYGGRWKLITERFLYGVKSGDAKTTGGEAEHVLTVDEIPSHTHTGVPDLIENKAYGNEPNPYGHLAGWSKIDTGETGGGKAHNNMPPWYGVYIWERTA